MTATPETPTPNDTPDVTAAPQAPIEAPALPYSFKANLKEYRKRIGVARIIIALALTFIFWFRFGPVVWIISVVGIAALVAVILYAMSARRITITPEGIEYQSFIGRKRTIRFDQVEGVKVFLNYYEPTFGVAPRISIAQKGGKPLSLDALYWNVDDLDKLAAVLRDKKFEGEYYADVVNYSMIAKQFPNYATYFERHPFLVATFWTLGILVVVAVIAVLITFN